MGAGGLVGGEDDAEAVHHVGEMQREVDVVADGAVEVVLFEPTQLVVAGLVAGDDELVLSGERACAVELGVVKANAPRNKAFQVDGLSGATITGNGVDATIKLWLGPAGYGPYLQKLKAQG